MTPRNRIVTFRVSDEELESLFRACTQSGARSISEFARTATLEWARSQGAKRGFLVDDLATVAHQLEELNAELRDVSERIERLLGSPEPKPRSPLALQPESKPALPSTPNPVEVQEEEEVR
ncbi:MAG: hypothetical protein JNK87_09285 [Bryobacterales bacterium]|nr:hypothetical protein [Bryobacterales bacterium]